MLRERSTLFLALAGALHVLSQSVGRSAEQPPRAQADYFESKIRPLLVGRCYKCHSHEAEKLKGGFSLESREGILKGGDSGPAIVPGDPEKSLLIKAVRYTDDNLQMPPKGEKLSSSQIADLETWVKMGAPDSRVANTAIAKGRAKSPRDHWAFKPIKKPALPQVKDTNWVKNPIDSFILARMEDKGIRPNPPAGRRTLIRRATFDLTGLPPTQEEIREFLSDQSPEALAHVVDRLLKSPQYGERWGRYWLDVARYSDTKGEVRRNREDFRYPFAWTYRDYVIRSFNEDKPFTQFIIEQVAADRLPASRQNPAILAALGFLTLGERFNGNANDIINDRIDVVSKGFLGLTITCARCHDHKFDPVPTKDYYSLHGIFASTIEPSEGLIISTVSFNSDYADYYKKYTALHREMAGVERQKKGQTKDKEAAKSLQKEETRVRTDLANLEMKHPGAPLRAMALMDSPHPKDSPVFLRGEAENKGEIVPRQFPQILSPPNRTPFKNGSGRLELAIGIASPHNPLTPRVIVNRVWLHHFGEGIVTTPDDLGNQCAAPSHPELLDYLAARFMEEGWSIKKLHRLILLSSVYQEGSEGNPRYEQIDPENRLLWRANTRRLDIEAIRDSLLAIGGKLEKTMGGKPVNLGAYPYSTRRTIYGFIDRKNLPEVYTQFDFANPDLETGKRYETIVPQQSLFLMNSPLVMELAKNLIGRSDFIALNSAEERVKLLYELVYQREPTSLEIKLGVNFIQNSPEDEVLPRIATTKQVNQRKAEKLAASFASIPTTERRLLTAWEKYAHALLQANEAIFVN